jgi:small conductance mechanosensitive channel
MSILNQILGIPAAIAQVSSTAAGKVASETNDEFGKIVSNFFAQIPLWIAAIVVALLSYVLAIIVRRSIENKLSQQGVDEEHKEVRIVAGRGSFFIVITIGFTTALSIVGIDLAPIVAAGAFGLGFALKDIIMNSVSGMFILASRHYTIGDVIKIKSVVGKIEDIQTRATIIRAFDGTRVIVPNAFLFKNIVISKTSNPFRKLSFKMSVDYGADLKQVMELCTLVVSTIPWVLKKPKPSVFLGAWGKYAISFKVNVWIDSKGGKLIKTKNAVILELSKAFAEAGIKIPYPIQTLHLDQADEEEISKDEITQRVTKMKEDMKNKNIDKSTMVLSPSAAAGIEKAKEAAPKKPAPTPLPTAIDTTPNSPGQNWLEDALTTQVGKKKAEPEPPVQTVQPETQPTAPQTSTTVATPTPQEPTAFELPAAAQTPSAPAQEPVPTPAVTPVVPANPAPEQPAATS